MDQLMDCNIVIIHLKTAKKNDRMDICRGYFEMIENGAIIINKLFETIYYFPESFSNHEVQACMQKNSHRTFLSIHKCICSLNQHNQNVVLVSNKRAYAMEKADSLIQILLDLSKKYKKVFDFEYDAIKNCLQEDTISENGEEDVRFKHTEKFESMVVYGNTKCESQEKKNGMQKRRRVLKPRRKMKEELDNDKYFPNLEKTGIKFESMVDCGNTKCESQEKKNSLQKRRRVLEPRRKTKEEFDNEKYFPNLEKTGIKFESMVDCGNTKCESQEKKNSMQKRRVLEPRRKMKEELDNEKYFPDLEITVTLPSIPIFRTHDSNPAMLMAVVNSNIDPYSLCEANSSLGEIVYDCAGPESVVPQPQPSHQTNTRNFTASNATVSNDNPTQTRRLEESSNSESVASSIHSAHEQHGNQQNFISSGRILGREHFSNLLNNGEVPVFTASDRIRSPQYQAYHVRLSTFTRWPSNMTQKPEQVAQAGFYYTGLQDVVRCFACDGGLKNWDPEDDPWIEHARWFPQCPFVQKVKGQEFVDLVRRMTEESDEEEDAVVHSTFQRNNPMANPPNLQQLNLGNDTDEPSQLDTDAAQSVLQTGYSKSTVATAVEELISKGKREYTAQDIIEVILEKEDREEHLPKEGRSKLPRIPSQSFRSTQSATEDMGKILRENESLKSIVACMKCKVQAKDILFLPCTHHCLCHICAEKCSLCPVCYKIIKQKIKTFMI